MKDLKLNLLRYNQRQDLKAEIDDANKGLPYAKPDEKGAILQRQQKTQKQLDTQSPEPLTPKERDTLSALEKKLRSKITHNMPTQEVMRKNPAGAVDWHTRWEKANKPALRIWKNVRIQLDPENSDRDLCNIERYRPTGQTDRMRTDAQIPGLMSYGNIDEADWPFNPPTNTALEQAKRVYTEEDADNAVNKALDESDADTSLLPANESDEGEEKTPLSAEKQAVLVNRLVHAREALAAKRASDKHIAEISSAVPVGVSADSAAAV